ncbi:MAG: decarboxylase [Nanoarchaeota archaeon]|nr:decarboxylase [Nanoarchaeota archaeon]MBU1445314.1 decarboxylase [Nanoarchaeota archaeon]MBU2420510.1 decarboxylase [Nanoarchaeota archaeon]MBU2475065.1 decarboxylase [Nanoarchaeota archaeon]
MKPKFLLSKSKVLEQYNKVKEYADIVSYSSKTNQEVIKILEKETDSMFSVHFFNELKHVKDKSKIIFLAQAWKKEDIKELTDLNIKTFIVDNEQDLNILLDFLKENKIQIDLLLRAKYKENTIRTEKHFVFGMDSIKINKYLKELKNNNQINNLGIHFHRKTQNLSEWNLKYELQHFVEEENWKNIDFVNIGGGIPAVYANTNEDVIQTIFNKIKELKQFLNEKNIKLIIEPGRFISAPSIKLQTEIVAIYENNIIVNASIYNSDMDALIVPVKLLVEGELEKGQGKPFVIKGITPCSLDLFRYRVYLENPKVGDILTFLNAGAYNFTTNFCDLEKIETESIS